MWDLQLTKDDLGIRPWYLVFVIWNLVFVIWNLVFVIFKTTKSSRFVNQTLKVITLGVKNAVENTNLKKKDFYLFEIFI